MSKTIYYDENEKFLEVFDELKQKTPEEVISDNSKMLPDKILEQLKNYDPKDNRYFRQPDKVSKKTIGIGAVIIVGIAIWYFLRRK